MDAIAAPANDAVGPTAAVRTRRIARRRPVEPPAARLGIKHTNLACLPVR